MVLSYVKNLESSVGAFSPDGPKESPASIVWTKAYLAQHYDHFGDTANALKFIDEALAHTPTIIELYLFKGKIFKVIFNFSFFF